MAEKDKTDNTEVRIEIIEGHASGGYFHILPIKFEPSDDYMEADLKTTVSRMIAIDEDYILQYLRVFLERHLNKELTSEFRDDDEIKRGIEFDWYGDNIYSYSDIKEILTEIKATVNLLEKDYDNPLFDEVKKNISYIYLMDDYRGPVSKEEERRIIKDNIGVVIDFYERFIARMELMMRRYPDYSMITFYGP